MTTIVQMYDQSIVLDYVAFDYSVDLNMHKVVLKSREGKMLRLTHKERGTRDFNPVLNLKNLFISALQEGLSALTITPIVHHIELKNPKADKNQYQNDFYDIPKQQSQLRQAPTERPFVLVSEQKTQSTMSQYIHILRGNIVTKVDQHNLSRGGNVFTITLSTKTMHTATLKTIPVLRFELDAQLVDDLAYRHKSLDAVRKLLDDKVRQATKELQNNPPKNNILTPQFLLNHYQSVLPLFLKQRVQTS